MKEFKAGDKVRRAPKHRGSWWRNRCHNAGVAQDAVFTVKAHKVSVLELEEMTGTPLAEFFELVDVATEPTQDTCDSPSYDLLATISRLECSVEHYREWVAGLELELDATSQQLGVATQRNNTLTDQLDDLRAQLAFSGTLVQESDAAGAVAEADLAAARDHAKQLAADLEYSRHSWRLAQYQLTQVKAVLGGVACTLHTVNLGELASQLRGVAAGLESIDNGADAALVRRAGNLLDLFNMVIVDGKRQ